jgi:hypothetical protein
VGFVLRGSHRLGRVKSIPFVTIGRFHIRDHNWCERIMIGVM